MIHNTVLFPFENNDGTNVKYVHGSISGELFLNDILSETEILAKYPNIKHYPNMHEICKAWGNRM